MRASPAIPISAAIALAAPLLSACSDAESSAGFAQRDSAGIAIIENSSPRWGDGDGWQLSDAPLFEVGALDGPDEYQLFQVSGAARLSDGRIAVANGGSGEIRVFSDDGLFEASMGREGGGPGEFRVLSTLIALPGDSLLAYDWRERRLTVFTPAGDLVRSSTLNPDSAGGPPRLVDRLSDGSLVVQAAKAFSPPDMRSGLMRTPAIISRVAPDGTPLNHIADLAGEERLLDVGEGMVSVMMLPVFRTSRAVSGEAAVYAADTDRHEIRRYDPDGTLERVIRLNHPERPITGAHLEEFGAHRMEEAETPEQRQRVEGLIARMELPETMPAFADLMTDADGNLWVREFVWPEGGGPRWSILDADGHWLGDVKMPDGFRPLEIGSDYVLGVWSDDLDVQYVHMYGLTKPDVL